MNERSAVPHPPYDELRTAIGDDPEGNAALDDLHAALHDEAARPADVAAPVGRLRAIPELEARIANWFDAPRTQNWLQILNDAGL